jgi:hypothetical protein
MIGHLCKFGGNPSFGLPTKPKTILFSPISPLLSLKHLGEEIRAKAQAFYE